MNYDMEQFFNLVDEAEAQGVEHLGEICSDAIYEFDGLRQKVKRRGCHNASMFAVPYEDSVGRVADAGIVKVCAVHDSMGRWPRFGGDQFGKDADARD